MDGDDGSGDDECPPEATGLDEEASDPEWQLDADLMSDLLAVHDMRKQVEDLNALYDLRYFGVEVTGTDYTLKHKNVASDFMKGVPKDADAVNFALLYLPQRTISFGTMKKFSKSDAEIMARAWAHRAEFFFKIWLNESELSFHFQFTVEHLARYEAPPEFVKALNRIETIPRLAARVQEVRNLVPTLNAPNLKKYEAYHQRRLKTSKPFAIG